MVVEVVTLAVGRGPGSIKCGIRVRTLVNEIKPKDKGGRFTEDGEKEGS